MHCLGCVLTGIGLRTQLNQYETAIQAVGSILEAYDTDKRYPVHGFGAKLPNGTVSHMVSCLGGQTQWGRG